VSQVDWIILFAVALSLWVGHVFPWHILPGVSAKTGELHRVVAYVYGVSCILAGLAVWCVWHPHHWQAFRFVALLAVAAGAGTVVPRVLEYVAENQARAADLDDYEREVRRGRPDA
jgi:hypothetical protein